MKIEFTKNLQFTSLIKANGQLKEFNFRKINGQPESLFSVDVSDERGNRKIFKMQKKDEAGWKIIDDQLPEWISNNEAVLNDLIEQKLTNQK